jgi:DNA-binding transcriptional LysR family regulator
MAKIVDWDDHIGRRVRLRDLRVFFTVVQSGSLSKAAARLHVSQPAVSQVIADLERSAGAKLFDRSTRGVEPTLYGRALLSRGQAAFDELRQGFRDIECLADPTAGEVRIGSTAATTETLLPHFIHHFIQQYPRAVIHVDDAPRPALELSGLRDRKVDLILGRPAMSPASSHLADFNVEVLFHDQLVIAAGIHNRWTRRRKIDLADLVNEPWILTEPDSWNYQRLAEAFNAQGLAPPKASLVAFSITLGSYLLAKGPYIRSLPRSALQLSPYRQSLKQLPIDLPTRPWPFAIITLKNRTLAPVVDRFIACMRDVVVRSFALGPSGKQTAPP